MPFRTSNKSASKSPGQYQIFSRPSSPDSPTVLPLPDLSKFDMSGNAPTIAPPVLSRQAIPIIFSRRISLPSLPPHNQHHSTSPQLEGKLGGPVTRTSVHTQATSSPLVPRNTNNTLGRQSNLQTPSRSSATLSQAYAGPSFHASPAASALPIPQWCSETTNERKEPIAEIFLETAAKKPSSDADRPGYLHNLTNKSSQKTSVSKVEASSDSFVLKHGSHLKQNLSDSARPSTTPSDISAQIVDEEEKRKARRAGLKKLLQTLIAQSPVSASSHLRTIASEIGSRAFPSAPSSSERSISMASPPVKLPEIPYHSYIPASCPHDSTQELLETVQKSGQAAQLLAPYYTPDTFNALKRYYDFDDFGMLTPRIKEQPLPYGQRGLSMENYLGRETSFESISYTISSQSSSSVESTSSEHDDRMEQMKDYLCHVER